MLAWKHGEYALRRICVGQGRSGTGHASLDEAGEHQAQQLVASVDCNEVFGREAVHLRSHLHPTPHGIAQLLCIELHGAACLAHATDLAERLSLRLRVLS